MSNTAEPLTIDGDEPRLASGPIAAPAPAETPDVFAPTSQVPAHAAAPTLPLVSPVLPESSPTAARTPHGTEGPRESDTVDNENPHPMAHLMPQKSIVSEASRRAAEQRAEKKAKARKIKIGVAIGSLVVVGVVGPPLGRWLADAVNEAGSTSTEEPAG